VLSFGQTYSGIRLKESSRKKLYLQEVPRGAPAVPFCISFRDHGKLFPMLLFAILPESGVPLTTGQLEEHVAHRINGVTKKMIDHE